MSLAVARWPNPGRAAPRAADEEYEMSTLRTHAKRILVVDDSEEIHADFRRILVPSRAPSELDAMEAELFGSALPGPAHPAFEIESAYQGQDACEIAARAITEQRPFSVAFVDMRMPPGWDGLETIDHLWKQDPDIQVVLCTAYSDYSWGQLRARLGRTDKLLILKKPFDNIEVIQLACSLTEKWALAEQVNAKVGELSGIVTRRTVELESAHRELIELNSRLEKAWKAAEAARQIQSDFLANMSHEIRTPMNGVLGMISLLRDTTLSSAQIEYVDTLDRSAEALMALLNDILDLSKIEAGRLVLEPLEFDLCAAVEDVGELLTGRALEKGVELALYYAPDAPRRVIGDPHRIRQILSNLVSNAIKFTDQGHVLVEVVAASVDAARNAVRLDIAVSDTGIGIPQQKLSTIFERFAQAESSTTRRYGGTGLGLAIVRELADLMSATIDLESTVGTGTRFALDIELPLAGDGGAATGLRKEPPPGGRALVISHRRVVRAVFGRTLEQCGVHAECASSRAELDQLLAQLDLERGAYRLIVVDAEAPEFDAVTVAKTVRGCNAGRSADLVLLSALSSKVDYAMASDAGYTVHLVKPMASLYVPALLGALSAPGGGSRHPIITRRTLRDGVGGKPGSPRDAHRTAVVRGGRVLLVEDNAVNQKLAVYTLSRLGCEVEVAVNGAEAVDMAVDGDFDAIFMDCQMPVMDGYTATAELRKRQIAAPIIAMTANALAGDSQRCLAAGMDDYIAKPISRDRVRAALDRWLPGERKAAKHDA
jgi:signal transduction histidine kinase